MKPIIYPIGQHASLIYIKSDRFKSELLSVSFAVPLFENTAQKNAMVMALSRRGTASFPTQALINEKLDLMYSTSISASARRLGDMHALGFSADFLGARYVAEKGGLLPDVVRMYRELLRAPLLDEHGHYTAAFVESEKQNLRDAIRAEINNPRSYAISRCRRLLCEGEGYALSLLGSEESIDALSAEDLADRYRALTETLSPVFCYVGNTDACELAALLRDAFGDFGGVGVPYSSSVHLGKGMREETAEMPLFQGKLSIGFRSDISLGHRLAPALMMLNEIFGASPASKLFMNVRERMSLCYHCSSALDLFKGTVFANCGMKVENRAVAEEAMLAQLAEIGKGNITDVEFDAARHSLANTYRQAFDNPGVLSRFYTGRAMIGDDETVTSWREKLVHVTLDEVVEAAEHLARRAVFFLKGTRDGEDEGEE
ncbi:MAG: insulinase family protein [Ruminococcaceae bacterium]|nr:insulinase family protein [Oscillospiraceae bacterium]